MTAELGRQPWLILWIDAHGAAESRRVWRAGNAWFTLIGFMGMYTVLAMLWLFLVYREIELGPDPDDAAARTKTQLRPGSGLRRTMGTIWFCLVAVMIAMYVLLDGFDLGAGAIHLLVAKTDEERRQVLASIGPVWDGNEVWLIAAGGTLYFAFPRTLCQRVQRILSAADDGAVASDSARSFDRVSQSREERGVGSAVGFSVSALRVCCWPYFTARRWPMWCAASHSMPAVISSSRCGPISGSGKKLESWTGTRFWLACSRCSRW